MEGLAIKHARYHGECYSSFWLSAPSTGVDWAEQKILVTQKLPGKKSTYGNHWGHTSLHCLYMGKLTEEREDGAGRPANWNTKTLGGWEVRKMILQNRGGNKMEEIWPISLLSGWGVRHDIFKLLKVFVQKKTRGFFLSNFVLEHRNFIF